MTHGINVKQHSFISISMLTQTSAHERVQHKPNFGKSLV